MRQWMTRVRAYRLLSGAALLLLSVSYLPDVFGKGSGGYDDTLRPATLVITVLAALVTAACVLNSRRAWPYQFNRRALRTWQGICAIGLVATAVIYAVLTAAASKRQLDMPNLSQYYCTYSRFPQHRAACQHPMVGMGSLVRDYVRAALFLVVAFGIGSDASARVGIEERHAVHPNA